MGITKEEKSKRRKEKAEKIKGMVVLPYVKDTSEKIERILKKYGISSAMRPHKTIRSLVVHPKDKRTISETSGIVYNIPCKDCNKSYIGETGRLFRYRQKEHQDEGEEKGQRHYTRNNKNTSKKEIECIVIVAGNKAALLLKI